MFRQGFAKAAVDGEVELVDVLSLARLAEGIV